MSVPVAAAAGLLSFLSPCVLPLVPAYVGFLSGVAVQGVTAASR
ncbi:MAG: cytochrome c biogenesis protein CcdA [Thermoflexales bacterium]|nr:cytochrome c biogenesis protein CcdA [Thermoflexales bacterium]